MAKASDRSGDSVYRTLPSVERVLSSSAFAQAIAELGRARVKDAVVAHLNSLRSTRTQWDETVAVAHVSSAALAAVSTTLRRVVNATGVLIHTNLGRSPVSASAWESAGALTTGYSNLEFDLESGERGARDEHLSAICRELFGCEAAVLTNNNAAGTLLLLAATAAGREVIVSRGELVEIGGAFRVPDVIQQGGAKLREVGTTNRTRARDYADATGRKTAALLRVHRSNFDIVGFTEMPSIDELVAVARAKKKPLLYDEGSGRVVDLSPYGFSRAATIRELIAAGVDAITCSTDKLIGATQGGLILGTAAIVEQCRRHPLMRALRAGKESYGVIAATLRSFATGKHETEVPVYRMLAAPLEQLRERAGALAAGTKAKVVDSRAVLGGGTTPTETIASIALEVPGNASELHARLLRHATPIVGRIENDRLLLDVRTVLPEDERAVRDALRSLG